MPPADQFVSFHLHGWRDVPALRESAVAPNSADQHDAQHARPHDAVFGHQLGNPCDQGRRSNAKRQNRIQLHIRRNRRPRSGSCTQALLFSTEMAADDLSVEIADTCDEIHSGSGVTTVGYATHIGITPGYRRSIARDPPECVRAGFRIRGNRRGPANAPHCVFKPLRAKAGLSVLRLQVFAG